MKRLFAVLLSVLLSVCMLLSGCDIPEESDNKKREDAGGGSSKRYSVGDVVSIAGKEYNVYKISSGTVMLLATQKIGMKSYYEIEHCINEYKQQLTDSGVKFKYVGLLDYRDLDDLGGNKHTVSISGIPYLCDDAPDFVQFEEGYWLGGYSKYDTYTWLYENKKILHIQFEDSHYAVRPVVYISSSDMP